MKKRKLKISEQRGQVFVTSDTHKTLAEDLTKVLKNYEKQLHPLEICAVMAHALGSMLALVDERNIASGLALETIQRNMDAGNEEAHLYTTTLDVLQKSSEPGTEH